MLKTVGVVSFSFFSVIGLTIWGYEFVIMAVFLLLFLMFIDVLLGYWVARNQKKANSYAFTNGMIKKSIIWIIVMVISLVCWQGAYHFGHEIRFGLIPIGFIVGFVYGELMSIIENWRRLDGGNKYETRLVDTLYSILGLGFEKGLDIAEKKAKEKINSLTSKYRDNEENSNNTSLSDKR